MLRKLKWQVPGEPLAARYNWCQGTVPGRGPAVEKHCPRRHALNTADRNSNLLQSVALVLSFLWGDSLPSVDECLNYNESVCVTRNVSLLLSNKHFIFGITKQAPDYSELCIGLLVYYRPTEKWSYINAKCVWKSLHFYIIRKMEM